MKVETWICHERPEHFNLNAALFHRSPCLTRVFLSQPAVPPCTLPSISDPPPHPARIQPLSLQLSIPPSQPSSIYCLAADRTHDTELLNSSSHPKLPILSPSLVVPCPELLPPSIMHPTHALLVWTPPTLYPPDSAHPLKTLISISCLHSVGQTGDWVHSLLSAFLLLFFASLLFFLFSLSAASELTL